MQYLYKYRPDDIFTIKLLCDQRLHFSHPNAFNDPFDCKPLCSQNVEDSDILSHVEHNCSTIRDLMEKNMGGIQSMIKRGDLQKSICDTLNLNYICCFSYNADIPAMWAHYAQDHKGLCLGFDTAINSPFLEGMKGLVKYSDKQAEFNWTKVNREEPNIRGVFFEKAKMWEYEQEYRIVKHHRMIKEAPDSYNIFRKEALVAMFFGLRMPQERQDFYRLLCKQCGLENVKFFKMSMPTDGTYYLIPKEL